MRISVIIPTLEEEAAIGGCVAAVRALAGDWEVVVVDGGSRDRSLERAAEAGADLSLLAPAGRGHQLAAGAAAATSQALLFLHADCRLPASAAAEVGATLEDSRWSGGAFALRHECGPAAGPLARRLVRIADRRSRRARLPYGDQALFTRRETLERAGGVPEQPLMEDLELSRRLDRLGPIRRLPAEVRTDARRFEQRPVHSFLCWMSFPLLFRLGASPERLARWYGSQR